MNFAPWQPCTDCSGGPQPGAVALLAWLRESAGAGWSGGIYNCRPVRGTTSMSIHACGRAVDWMMPMNGGKATPEGMELVGRLGTDGKRLGLQLVIYNRRIWGARTPDGAAYKGVHPHYDHLHIELTPAAGRNLTLTTVRNVMGADDMTPEQDKMLRAVFRELCEGGDDATPPPSSRTVRDRTWQSNAALGRMEKQHGPGLSELDGA